MKKEDEITGFCGAREEGTKRKKKTRRKRALSVTVKTKTGIIGDD